MEFRKTIRVSAEDYYSFNKYHLRAKVFLNPILFLILIPLACYLFFDLPKGGFPNVTLTIALPAAVVLCSLLAFLSLRSLKRAAAKRYNENEMLQAEVVLWAGETGIGEQSAFTDSHTPWPDVARAAETKNGIYLYISGKKAFIIPKRLLTAAEDEALRALVKKHLHKKRNQLRRK